MVGNHPPREERSRGVADTHSGAEVVVVGINFAAFLFEYVVFGASAVNGIGGGRGDGAGE